MRATTSVGPPAANGTRSRTVPDGNSCDCADVANSPRAQPSATPNLRIPPSSSFMFRDDLPEGHRAGRILAFRLAPMKGLIRHSTDHQQEGVLMLQTAKRFLKDESGATAIEYGLICAGIAVAIITILQGLGASLVELLSKLLNAIG